MQSSRNHGIGMTSQRTRNRLVDRLRRSGVEDERVLSAIADTPRHLFVEEALSSRAYEDTALPIGRGQTISQPLIVAMMTAAIMHDQIPEKVLEIGTGSGYQAVILSRLVKQVYSVERIEELFRSARRVFRKVGSRNIRCKQSDGYLGWPENAPYDAIVVTAAAPQLPDALFEQLKPGGHLVAPVGHGQHQQLIRYTRVSGGIEQENLGDVVFVPMLPGLD